MLTETQIAQYHRDGFVVPDFRLPESTLGEIRSRHAALLERHPEFRDYCPMLFQYDLGFFDYCDNPAILDMVEQLIGPDIALWNSSLFAKPAHDGKRTPWHQDGELLADTAARDLQCLAGARRLDSGERLPASHQGIAHQPRVARPPDGAGQ